MKWLFWKDYRHNRLVVFAALALHGRAAHVFAWAVSWDEYHGSRSASEGIDYFLGATLYGVVLAEFGRRRDRGQRFWRASESSVRPTFWLPCRFRAAKFLPPKSLLFSLIVILAIWSIGLSLVMCLLVLAGCHVSTVS